MNKLISTFLVIVALFSFFSVLFLPTPADAGWFSDPTKIPKGAGIFGISGEEVYTSTIIHKSPELMGGDVYLRYLSSFLSAQTHAQNGNFWKKKVAEDEQSKSMRSNYLEETYKEFSKGLTTAEYNEKMTTDPAFRKRVADYSEALRLKHLKDVDDAKELEFINAYAKRLYGYVRPDQSELSGAGPEYQETATVSVLKLTNKATSTDYNVVKLNVFGTDADSSGMPVQRAFDESAFLYSPATGLIIGATRDLLFGLNEASSFSYGKDQVTKYTRYVNAGPDMSKITIAKYYSALPKGLSGEALAAEVLKMRAGLDRPTLTKLARFRPVTDAIAVKIESNNRTNRRDAIKSKTSETIVTTDSAIFNHSNYCKALGQGNRFCALGKVPYELDAGLVYTGAIHYKWGTNTVRATKKVQSVEDEDGDTHIVDANVTYDDVSKVSSRVPVDTIPDLINFETLARAVDSNLLAGNGSVIIRKR